METQSVRWVVSHRWRQGYQVGIDRSKIAVRYNQRLTRNKMAAPMSCQM